VKKKKPSEKKKSTSFYLSPEALEKIAALARKLGVSQTSVVEMAVREMSSKHNLGSS
jgi:predicted DNA-binding protein